MMELPDDVLSRSTLGCGARDALQLAGACRAVLSVVTVTACRLFATIFASPDLPVCLLESRPRLLTLLDCARSADPERVRETFAWAAAFGFTACLYRLAFTWKGNPDALLDRRSLAGTTPLCGAARHCQSGAVAALLQLRADADRPDKGGHTPLFWAAQSGDVASVRQLLECGAAPTRTNKRGESPLGAVLHFHDGITANQLAALRLMARALDPTQRCSAPAVRVLLAACEASSGPCVAALLDAGVGPAGGGLVADPAAAAAGAAAPAAAAYAPALSAAVAAARRTASPAPAGAGSGGAGLVVSAAPLSQRPPAAPQRPRSARAGGAGGGGSTGSTALAEVGTRETTPLLIACGKGSCDIVQLLLEQSEHCRSCINATLPSGKSALYLAAERGDARICARLLGAGASIDVATCGGRSALYVAVEFGHLEAVQAICEHAEVHHLTQPTPKGLCPVLLAERRGRPALIAPLLLCYQRQVRRRLLTHGLGDADDNVSHPYLTALCVRYKEQLFHEGGGGAAEPPLDPPEQLRGVSQTARVARWRPKRSASTEPPSRAPPGGERCPARRSPRSAHSRLQRPLRVAGLLASEGGGTAEGGCSSQLPAAQVDESGASGRAAAQPRPGRSRRPEPEAVGSQQRPGSAAAGGREASGRQPRGSAAAQRRPASAAASSRRRQSGGSERRRGGQAARTTVDELWQAALRAHIPEVDAAPPVVAPVGHAASWSCARQREEGVAIEADDAMEELLAGYLSAGDEQPVGEPGGGSTRLACNADMYSDCSED